MEFTLTSPVFLHNEKIPQLYTCDGEHISPPLNILNIPNNTVSLVLIMYDPDIPKALYPNGGTFDHWILFNIPTNINDIPQNSVVGTLGVNSLGKTEYTGPCPPSEYKPYEHRYFFHLYALDILLQFSKSATKDNILSAIEGHILATTELIGRYSRK